MPMHLDAILMQPDAILMQPDAMPMQTDAMPMQPDAMLMQPDAMPMQTDAMPMHPLAFKNAALLRKSLLSYGGCKLTNLAIRAHFLVKLAKDEPQKLDNQP
jgi:hypothetical protein